MPSYKVLINNEIVALLPDNDVHVLNQDGEYENTSIYLLTSILQTFENDHLAYHNNTIKVVEEGKTLNDVYYIVYHKQLQGTFLAKRDLHIFQTKEGRRAFMEENLPDHELDEWFLDSLEGPQLKMLLDSERDTLTIMFH